MGEAVEHGPKPIEEPERVLDLILRSEDFWDQQGYRIWFHGKDLMKAMQKRQPDLFPLKSSFLPWAAERFEHTGHPDLAELERRLDSKV